MKVIRCTGDGISVDKNTSLTVGTFDGVHCGHRGLFDRMSRVANEHNERTVVVTFDPHPQIVLNKPEREPLKLLTTIEERCELFERSLIDVAIVIPFSTEFASVTAEEFIRTVIVQNIGVQHFFIGHDHSFGKDRGGNEELLQRLAPECGYQVVPVPPLICDGVVVSSTKVRAALKEGRLDDANSMLGRPYSVRGTVVRGDGRGRGLGIPTANIELDNEHKLLPCNGIYVASAEIHGERMIGMASVGVRPMFTSDVHPTLEVNFLDFDADIYGEYLSISFHKRLRNEEKYETVDELLAQINIDKQQTRIYQHIISDRRSS